LPQTICTIRALYKKGQAPSVIVEEEKPKASCLLNSCETSPS
jgi:hypothetical protein